MKVIWDPANKECHMCGELRAPKFLFGGTRSQVRKNEDNAQGAWVCPNGHTGLIYASECINTTHAADLVEAERWTVAELLKERHG